MLPTSPHRRTLRRAATLAAVPALLAGWCGPAGAATDTGQEPSVPPFTIHLVLSALVGAAGTAMLARLWARRLSALVIIAISAVLTFTLFAMLPLYFMFFVPGKAGGLLFS